jgi:hypothetical protein
VFPSHADSHVYDQAVGVRGGAECSRTPDGPSVNFYTDVTPNFPIVAKRLYHYGTQREKRGVVAQAQARVALPAAQEQHAEREQYGAFVNAAPEPTADCGRLYSFHPDDGHPGSQRDIDFDVQAAAADFLTFQGPARRERLFNIVHIDSGAVAVCPCPRTQHLGGFPS